MAALRRLEEGVPIGEVAPGWEVNPNVLHRWRCEFRQGPGNASPSNGKQRSRRLIDMVTSGGLTRLGAESSLTSGSGYKNSQRWSRSPGSILQSPMGSIAARAMVRLESHPPCLTIARLRWKSSAC